MPGVSVKTEGVETAEMLIAAGVGVKAPYLHRSWINLPWSTPEDELRHRLAASYRLVRAGLTRRLRPRSARSSKRCRQRLSSVIASSRPAVEPSLPSKPRPDCDQRQERGGELLAELDAPLVEAVDAPDHALDEHPVLVERDDPAEGARVELGVDQRRRRAVAGEDLVRRERRVLHRLLGLGEAAAAHQRLGLGEAVGEQELVLVVERRLVADGGDHELAGDDLGALVDQLVEGVLAVGAGLAPDHRAGGGRRPASRRG